MRVSEAAVRVVDCGMNKMLPSIVDFSSLGQCERTRGIGQPEYMAPNPINHR